MLNLQLIQDAVDLGFLDQRDGILRGRNGEEAPGERKLLLVRGVLREFACDLEVGSSTEEQIARLRQANHQNGLIGCDAAFVEHGRNLPTWKSTMHLYPVNGAAARIKNKATAWAYRDATWAAVIVGVDNDPANKDAITNWAREYWNALHPYSAPGAYVNFMMDEGEDRVKATYGKNYPKLTKVKKKYDRNNLFRFNQNIRPAK